MCNDLPKSIINLLKPTLMNRKQERKYSMYKAVNSFLVATLASIIAKMPNMADAMTQLQKLIDDIADYIEAQESNRKGYSQGKEISKELVVNTIFVLAGQVKSFAVDTNNLVLKNEMTYTDSKLLAMADNRLYATANRIIAKADQNIASLDSYGLTPEKLIDIQTLVEIYNTKISEPRNAASQKAEDTLKLEQAIKDADELLIEKMDTYVIIVKNSDPEFFNIYHSNRKIIGPGYKTLPVRCNLKSPTGEPLHRVTATIEGINRKFKTTAKGTFLVKSIPEGMHTIKFYRADLEPFTTNFPVTKGLRTDLYLTLNPL